MANEQLGPVERGLGTGVSWVIDDLAPKGDQQAWRDYYAANRNMINTGIVGAGVVTANALAEGASNAFGGNNNNNNGGGGGGWGWLAPLAMMGGIWAWNKWGDQVTNLVNTKLKNAQDWENTKAWWVQGAKKVTDAAKSYADWQIVPPDTASEVIEKQYGKSNPNLQEERNRAAFEIGQKRRENIYKRQTPEEQAKTTGQSEKDSGPYEG